MKILNLIIILVIVILIVGGVLLLLRGFNGGEDNWIKDNNGVWIKHGVPGNVPSYVLMQQQAVLCANDLYVQAKAGGMKFDSQCLGACGNYSVDIVHVPRSSYDNLKENQCKDFIDGKTKYFIELDSNGNLVRVFEG